MLLVDVGVESWAQDLLNSKNESQALDVLYYCIFMSMTRVGYLSGMRETRIA
jgi:hypothetical protein